MKNIKFLKAYILFIGLIISSNTLSAKIHLSNYLNNENNFKLGQENLLMNDKDTNTIYVEYIDVNKNNNEILNLPRYNVIITKNAKITTYRNNLYQMVIHEIDRGSYTEINGEFENLSKNNSSITIRINFPLRGKEWKWYSGLDEVETMNIDKTYDDTIEISTVLPPDGAFNGNTLAEGGYGDAVGQGVMSYYPLCAINIDNNGEALGIDMSLPIVYRLSAEKNRGLIAEFDIATSPLTEIFPNRAFFKLVHFNFNTNWGMRAALKEYYLIYPENFKKRVVTEGVWLPFTPLRSIPNWEDFGFAYHETSWNNQDIKEGKKLPNIISDKETGVLSFQYTEPWDVQFPILSKEIDYNTLISNKMIPLEHREYIKSSATEDKNGLYQTRRLETPWFTSGWAVSITTNCDPDLLGYNRYLFVKEKEIIPALKMNVDGIYFDSMEWNWHHDLNYRKDHFSYTNYPLTFSKNVGRPAIWNFVSEFEFMKKIADEMHSQGKLVMGNGHHLNPFAATNLDLFGAELSWYSSGAHDSKSLDFKRIISYQKPIVFLLNEGLNDKAFTDFPYEGYQIYFEKLLAYGFFPSFFSTDASSDPYWQDQQKVENGRPYFKKYIPIIRQIAQAGWEPVTVAKCNDEFVRIERFGEGEELFFTIRNNGKTEVQCVVSLHIEELKIVEDFSAQEMVEKQSIKVENNKLYLTIPALRTQVIHILQ